MINLKFTKMHGLGNDFIVLDGVNHPVDLSPEQISALSRRDTGIGFDQCLVVAKSHEPDIDFAYRIFNADGHEVGQCGNGARCLARFLQHYQLTNQSKITVATPTTRMTLIINEDQSVTVNMGKPKLNPEDIPIKADKLSPLYSVPLNNGITYAVHAINVGNPHGVLVVPDVNKEPVDAIGQSLSTHSVFPEHANIGFMAIKNPAHIQLRVYERGCGETRACGSGAVAAAAIGRLFHHLEEKIRVDLPGGSLTIHWPDIKGDIFLTGPATFVYEGHLMTHVN